MAKKDLSTIDAVDSLMGTDCALVEIAGSLRRVPVNKLGDAAGMAGDSAAQEALYSYGVEIDTTVSSPTLTRIGNTDLHKSLPVQSAMRGCTLDDDGNVVDYLGASTWEGNVRDGDRGQVMVEIPQHYRRFETDGTKLRIRLSQRPLAGYERVPKCYVSAYEATVDRSVSGTPKLASVVNATAAFRGGNNDSSLDGTYKTQLGRAATNINLTTFRTYARNRKSGSTEWNCYTYDVHKTLYWLFVVEYATLNSQAAYNAALTSAGYRQGGLGNGVTTFDYTVWTNFNGRYPFVPCGVTDSLGNGTGTVSYTASNDDGSITKTFAVPRYRGVENPFGHLIEWTDGALFDISPNTSNGGTGLSKAYVCHAPADFSSTSYANYGYVGDIARETSVYIKSILFGVGGEILPKTTGGSSTTYFCDYTYTSIPTSVESTPRGLLFGGSAAYGADAGLASARSIHAPSDATTYFGSRLCFIPT